MLILRSSGGYLRGILIHCFAVEVSRFQPCCLGSNQKPLPAFQQLTWKGILNIILFEEQKEAEQCEKWVDTIFYKKNVCKSLKMLRNVGRGNRTATTGVQVQPVTTELRGQLVCKLIFRILATDLMKGLTSKSREVFLVSQRLVFTKMSTLDPWSS